MASTFESLLRLELQATGENANTWGEKTNNNLELLGVAIAGHVSISVAGSGDYTLTTANAATDQARRAFITLTGLLTGARNIIVPSSSKVYFIRNNTTGSHTLTVKTASGVGAVVPQGYTVAVACDGTDCFDASEVNRVARSGDTMTGLLTLSGDPTNALHAATKQYADAAAAAAATGRVAKSGDTMTGNLALPAGVTSTPSLTFSTDTNTGLFSAGADILGITTGGVERARFASGGAFLVGLTTTTPTSTDPGVHLSPAGLVQVQRGTSGDYASFVFGTTNAGNITTNGSSAVTYNTSSDYRLKTEVSTPAGFSAKLEAVPVRKYRWTAWPAAPAEYGFFAHELQEVWPQAVTGVKDGPMTQMVDYGRITPLLLGALKEALGRIKNLEDRVAELEEQVD